MKGLMKTYSLYNLILRFTFFMSLLLRPSVSLLSPYNTFSISREFQRCNLIPKHACDRPLSVETLIFSSNSNEYGEGVMKDDLDIPEIIQDINKSIIDVIKGVIVRERYYARFHALETIARVPYFAYESWNELHHLLIMEELGGDKLFFDRFLAQHIAFFYYWFVVGVYFVSPAVAYDLNRNVEEHAYESYDEFLHQQEITLKSLPAPQIAIDYYINGDLFLFDAFQHSTPTNVPVNLKINNQDDINSNQQSTSTTNNEVNQSKRRPKINNLYDVFVNIRDDEREHVLSMRQLQREAVARARDRQHKPSEK